MKKKVIALLLCTALSVSMLAGCQSSTAEPEKEQPAAAVTGADGDAGKEEVANLNMEGFPIVNEQITLTVYGNRDQNQAAWKDMLVMQKYEEMTNVHMDFQEVPADGFAENKQLLFASNELPDVFLRCGINQNEVSTYGVGSGQLMAVSYTHLQ